MFKLIHIVFSILIPCIISLCKLQDPKKATNLVTAGTAEIWCDESLQGIITQEKEIFEQAYHFTDLKIYYAPEQDIVKKLYQDSVNVIIVSHGIDTGDIKKFNAKKIFPKQYRFGKSALAFIGAKLKKQLNYSYDEMIELLKGKSNQIFVIESDRSGIANEILNHIQADKLGPNFFALRDKLSVIEYVNAHPDAIGIIDWSAISDSDDTGAQKILEKISLMGISTKDSKGEFYKPYQGNLNGLYPFTRDLYFIRRLGLNDVSLGFASFICDDRGQKILLKAGLLPEYQTERWIEFNGLKDVKVVK